VTDWALTGLWVRFAVVEEQAVATAGCEVP